MSPASRLDRAPFRVGDVLVEPARLRIVRDGEIIPLEPRWMGLLVHFADHAGEPVSDDTLLDEVWGTRLYGDNPLKKAVSKLREALGDDQSPRRYIERIHSQGYRLIPSVTVAGDYRRVVEPTPEWLDRNPFLGLKAFDDSHEAVFFGRERLVRDTLEAIRGQLDNQRRFVFLQGPSGCGKTSLLRAGIIPRLKSPGNAAGVHPLSISYCDLGGGHRDDIAVLLAGALSTWRVGERPIFVSQPQDEFAAHLCAHPDSISTAIEDALQRDVSHRRVHDARPMLLLVVDHAETLVSIETIDDAQRQAALAILRGVRESPHTLILTLTRSDFAPKLVETLPDLADWKAGHGHIDVLMPREGEIAEIIRNPAMKAGLRYEQDLKTLERLDDVLCRSALEQPDALPLLQHTLESLYDRDHAGHVLTFAAYRDIGGLEGALTQRAEAVFSALPPSAQARLDDVLAHIVVTQPDSDSISGQRMQWSAVSDPDTHMLLREFINARLFVSELGDGLPGFGVTHEALLRQWPRARDWARNNQRLLRARARLEHAAERWDKEGRVDDHLLNSGQPLNEAIEYARRHPKSLDERQRLYLSASERLHHRRRFLKYSAVSMLTILTIISGALAIVATRSTQIANERREEAQRLVDYMLGPLADDLRKQGKLELLGGVGSESLDYLSGRNQETPSALELATLAKGSRTLGEAKVQAEKREEAIKLFEKAKTLSESALSEDPSLEAALFERGNAAYWIGEIAFRKKNYPIALSHWREYLFYSERLISKSPDNPEWITEVSYGHNNLGTVSARMNDPILALMHFQKSAKLKEMALKRKPGDDTILKDLIDAHSWISSIQESLRMLDEAASGYDQQINLMDEITERQKDLLTWKHRLGNYLQLSASIEIKRGDVDKAHRALIRSVDLFAQITEKEPSNVEWAHDMLRGRLLLAEASFFSGDSDRMERELKTCRHLLAQHAEQVDSLSEWKSLAGKYHHLRSRQSRDDQTIHHLDTAIGILSPLTKQQPDDEVIHDYTRMLIERGRIRAASGDRDGALADWHTARAVNTPFPGKTSITRLHDWVEIGLLLGDADTVSTQMRTLTDAGYRHPDFIRITAPIDRTDLMQIPPKARIEPLGASTSSKNVSSDQSRSTP